MDEHTGDRDGAGDAASYITVAGRRFRLPGSRRARIGFGGLCIVGGILGFLPILGFWMIPLGLLILSVDLAPVRRWRRRLQVRIGRRRNARRTVDRDADG